MSLASDLVRTYKATFARDGWPSAWKAVHAEPSIPFVGKGYRRGGLLVYASAENLVGAYPDGLPEWVGTEIAWNRHRDWLARYWDGTGFPNIHCRPVQHGGLLVAAAMLATLAEASVADTPGSFLESVAVGNLGKFAVASATNQDYAGRLDKLRPSLPFVEADLAALRPSIVILPHVAWRLKGVQQQLQPSLKGVRVVPVPQCQARAINKHIVPRYARAHVAALAQRHADARWAAWLEDLDGGLVKIMWHYLAAVEDAWTASTIQ